MSALDRIVAELDLSELVGQPMADKAIARAQLKQLISELSILLAELDRLILENMEEDRVVIPGVATFERKQRGKRSKWQGERVRKELVAQFRPVDLSTGEVITEAGEIADAAMLELFRVAGLHRESHQWSTTELKKRDLRPGAFCEYVPGDEYLDWIA